MENNDNAKLEALARGRATRAANKAAGIEQVRKNPTERSDADPTSLRKAITAKCFECVGSGQDPNWQDTVRECPVTRCSLHKVRAK